LLDGEEMAALCREFDVSRKTGCKIFQRYKDRGLGGLTDRSRRPNRQTNQLPLQEQTPSCGSSARIPPGVVGEKRLIMREARRPRLPAANALRF
jgi:hypothetical protein